MQRTLIVIPGLSVPATAAAVELVGGQRIGNSEYFSNGQDYTTIGSQVHCN